MVLEGAPREQLLEFPCPFWRQLQAGSRKTWKGDVLLPVLLVSCHLGSVVWGQEQGDILCRWVLAQEPQPQPRLRNSVSSFGLPAAWVLSEIRTSGIYGFEGESKR